MNEKEMLEAMMQQLDTISQQQAQLVGHISKINSDLDDLKRLVDGQGDVLASVADQLGELDTKVDTIRDGLQSDLAAVELTTYKTATDVAKLKLAK